MRGLGWVPTKSSRYLILKRLFDIAVAVALLPVLIPLIILIGVMVAMSSGLPIFYRQARLGRDGSEFFIFKFRTMSKDADYLLAAWLQRSPAARAEWQQCHKLKNDPRITYFGHFLRKTSLDELPQILNVLRGEMSLVGPRPIAHAERAKYAERYAFYSTALPGVTGLWQVSGRCDLTYAQRVQLDEQYVREWTFSRDMRILLRTPLSILQREGAY